MDGRNGGGKKVVLFDKGRRSRAAHLAHLIAHAKPTVINMIHSLGKLLQQKKKWSHGYEESDPQLRSDILSL